MNNAVTRTFSRKAIVNVSNGRFWTYEETDILAATLMGQPLQKFAWEPVTGEWLFVQPGQRHWTAVAQSGSDFDDFVRGIVLPERRVICTRPSWPTWVRGGDPYAHFDKAAQVVSLAAQNATRRMLEAHGASEGWSWAQDVGNRRLEELTGVAARWW